MTKLQSNSLWVNVKERHIYETGHTLKVYQSVDQHAQWWWAIYNEQGLAISDSFDTDAPIEAGFYATAEFAQEACLTKYKELV